MTAKNKIKLISKRSFLDLYGTIKVKKPLNLRKLRQQFQQEIANRQSLIVKSH